MNSRTNEDLAWLRVQDMQREAENRHLMAGVPSFGLRAALARLIVHALAAVRSRQAGAPPASPPSPSEIRHHA